MGENGWETKELKVMKNFDSSKLDDFIGNGDDDEKNSEKIIEKLPFILPPKSKRKFAIYSDAETPILTWDPSQNTQL